MRYIGMLLVLTYVLFAECYPFSEQNEKLQVIESSGPICTEFEKNKFCIEKDIIQKDSLANKYQVICINDKKIASGYPEIKNKTFKTKDLVNNNFLQVSTNFIVIYGEKNLLLYNLKNKKFYKLNIPHVQKILKFNFTKDSFLYVEYLAKKTSSIDLIFIDLVHHKAYVLASKLDDVVRDYIHNRHIVVDQLNKDSFIKNIEKPQFSNHSNLINNNLTHLVNDFNIIEIKTILSDYNNSINRSYIFNSALELISEKELKQDSKKYVYGESSYQGFVHTYSLLIFIFSVLSIVFIFYVIKKIVGTYKLPLISSFFMLCYLIFVFIGASSLNIIYFDYEASMFLYERKDLLLNIWIYAISGLYLIPLGFYLSNKTFKYKVKQETAKFLVSKANLNLSKNIFYIIIFLFSISLIVLFLYINKLQSLPIIAFFQNYSIDDLSQLRSLSGNSFTGKVYRYMIFIKTIPLMLLLITYSQYKYQKYWKYLFWLLLSFNVFVNVMDLSKAPIIYLFSTLLIMKFFLDGYIKWKQVFIVLVGSFILLIILYINTMEIGRVLDIFYSPFHRAFIGSITPLYYWQLYVEQHGYLHGLSFPNPAHILPFKNIPISIEVMKFIHPESQEIGVVGSMPVVFFADAYINFGWLFALVSMPIFGFSIRTIDIFIIRAYIQNKSIIILSLLVYLIFYIKNYAYTTFFGIVIDPNIIIPILLTLILSFFSRQK